MAPPPGVKPLFFSRRTRTSQELLDLAEESGRLGMGLLGRQPLEFGEQLALPLGQVLRRLDHDLNVHVAGLFRAQHRHALAVETEAPSRLGALGNLHAGLVAIDGGHLELAAERRDHHRDRHPAMQVGTLALEERVRGDREEDIEAARRAAAHPGLAFAGKPYAGAVLDAGGNVDRERALAGHSPGARAGRTGIVDHLAAALAARAGALEREEALRVADATLTAASGTCLRLGAGLGAGARAGFAGHRSRDADLRGLAGIGLFQADLHVVAQVRAALAAAAAAAPTAAAHAEQIIEDIGEGRSHVAEPAGRTGALL